MIKNLSELSWFILMGVEILEWKSCDIAMKINIFKNELFIFLFTCFQIGYLYYLTIGTV